MLTDNGNWRTPNEQKNQQNFYVLYKIIIIFIYSNFISLFRFFVCSENGAKFIFMPNYGWSFIFDALSKRLCLLMSFFVTDKRKNYTQNKTQSYCRSLPFFRHLISPTCFYHPRHPSMYKFYTEKMMRSWIILSRSQTHIKYSVNKKKCIWNGCKFVEEGE